MSSLITAILAITAVVGAAPTLEGRDDFSYIIDPWATNPPPGQKGIASSKTSKRDTPQPPNVAGYDGLIPGCDKDPSYVIPKTTKYSINQGVKVPKKGDDDACTSGHLGSHCWTEYWLVEQAVEYESWRLQGSGIDCQTTSMCNSANSLMHQTCTTAGSTLTDGTDIKIFEGALSIEVDLDLFKASPGATFGGTTITKSNATTDLTQICAQTTDVATCQWDDKKCHQLWIADRVLHIWGYTQRVCNGGAKKIQQSTKRDDGKYVHGQDDFDFKMPINIIQGCGASCGDTSYNAPLPGNGERQPFPKPVGW